MRRRPPRMLQSPVDRFVRASDGVAVTIAAARAAQIPLVQRLAREIWHRHYPAILSAAQIDYMLERGYSDEALLRFVDEPTPDWRLQAWPKRGPSPRGIARCATMKLDKLYVLPQHHARHRRALIEHVAARARAGARSHAQRQSRNTRRFAPTSVRIRDPRAATFRSATASSWRTSSWCATCDRSSPKPLPLYDNYTRTLREFAPLVPAGPSASTRAGRPSTTTSTSATTARSCSRTR